ncbi:phenylacetate--CoA ligase family protein [Allopusillimonas soli]|uniref:AMP-binding protein n=1 Tax=Allopusillimonas soli TaxID=659016 RepID=A0A853FHS4_9BURK|nr:AMP-binding protein [Allopusillimonas soli]NYT37536.1 AMP-binding protein [Allopusillimonas soli]TEA74492.1 phenylacetate--CoA ligase family protein [Allopusillimonas soli]
MESYYEERETIALEQRERDLFARLPAALERARRRAPAIAQQLQGVDAAAIRGRTDLAHIPVIRKSELLQAQLTARQARGGDAMLPVSRIFGGFSTIGWGEALRVFASPGPIYEPESGRPDYWGFARSLYAAGFRPGDLVYNCFSYHFTPAGSMMETAAHAVGCTVFPGGVGQTELQVQAISDLQPDGYVGTPSFLRIILEKAAEMNVALPSLQRAMFSGEAYPPSLHAWFCARGIAGFQAYGSADLGMMAYETSAREGLVVNEDIILEIVRPGTGQPVDDGEVGEVVVTTLNPDYPLLRFGTGDLSAILPGRSPCGRSNLRIRGWMGRADQTTKVRGMFVHPGQVADVLARHPEVRRARLVVTGAMGHDVMVMKAEIAEPDPAHLTRLADSVRELTKLRAEIEPVAPGSLPNDGKVIEDARSYD